MTTLKNKRSLQPLRRTLRHHQTDAEKRFWLYVRNKQFYGLKFYRQYSVGQYILDFYCPAKRIAIELDGGQHKDQDKKDTERTEFLQQFDVTVLRFWNHEILTNTDGVLSRLEQVFHITPSSNSPHPSLSQEGNR
jgi:very-short-patch-repair endonuclease